MEQFGYSEISNRIGSGIFAKLNEKKEALVQAGKTVYNLSIGTPDFPPAPHVMQAMEVACRDPKNYKYSIADLPELTEAVCRRYEKRYGVTVEPEEVMSVYGSQEGMAHMGMVLCNPGDVILVPDPGYPIFEMSGIMAHAKVVKYPLYEENGYLPKLDELPEDVKRAAKYIIVSYPLNPVCVCATDSFYEELITFARENQIIILHDNAYSDIIYTRKQGKSFLSYKGAKEVGVEFYSLSKSFNLTGARISFVVGNREIVERFRAFRSQIDYGIFLPVQYAAIAALTGPDERVELQRQEYERRNRLLCGGLRELGWNVPDSQGTMFVWGPLPGAYKNSTQFCLDLMEETGMIVTPGSAFGELGENHVRMALVLSEEKIHELLNVLRESEWVKSWNQ